MWFSHIYISKNDKRMQKYLNTYQIDKILCVQQFEILIFQSRVAVILAQSSIFDTEEVKFS